jgi:hypothetical protein
MSMTKRRSTRSTSSSVSRSWRSWALCSVKPHTGSWTRPALNTAYGTDRRSSSTRRSSNSFLLAV